MEASKEKTLKKKAKAPGRKASGAGQRRRDAVAAATKKLQEGVKALLDSEAYKQYLSVMAAFHHYSTYNTLLIFVQCPNATHVAGYRTWQALGRTVRKGEKGIHIFAPMFFRRPDDGISGDSDGDDEDRKDRDFVMFRTVPVFDISQTEGRELPSPSVEALAGDVEGYGKLLEAIEKASPFPIEFRDIRRGAKGYCSFGDRRIAIRSGMSQLQTIKTAIHEVAHAKMHAQTSGRRPAGGAHEREAMEVQAESVAYVVCQHFGLDTSGYSFGYIAGWGSGKEAPELMASMEAIRNASHELITGIEAELAGQPAA